MSNLENKSTPKKTATRAEEQDKSLESKPNLKCLGVPKIAIIDDNKTLIPIAEPLLPNRAPAATTHMSLVSKLKKKGVLKEYEVIKKDVLENRDTLSIEEITKKLEEITSEQDICNSLIAATISISSYYPFNELKSLIGASVNELKDLNPQQTLEILDTKIASVSNLSSRKDRSLQDKRRTLRNFMAAVIKVEEEGISVYTSAGNIKATHKERQIDLLSLAAKSIGALDLDGKNASFAYSNDIVKDTALGVYIPSLNKKGIDYNNDGIPEFPLNDFLTVNGLSELVNALKNPDSLKFNSFDKSDFTYAKETFHNRKRELSKRPVSKNQEFDQLKNAHDAFFGVHTEQGLKVSIGQEGSTDYEVKHQVLQYSKGFYDLQEIRKHIGLPDSLNLPLFAYNLGEGDKMFFLTQNEETGEILFSNDFHENFELLPIRGTSFTPLNAIAKDHNL